MRGAKPLPPSQGGRSPRAAQGPRFEYRVFPARVFLEMFPGLRPKDSYLAENEESLAVREALESGFRWVRSEGDLAILERTS